MGTGTVVIVESDEWVARLLESALRDDGYDVTTVAEALAGVQVSHERKPECVVCATRLPDFDGAWVVGQIRAASARVAETPFLMLSGAEADDVVERGFRAGADAAMAKPFRVREVVAQVNALVGMAARIRRASDREPAPLLSLRPSLFPTEALRGSLSQMSLAMVLALLEMERRSGRLRISRDGAEAAIDLASGFATAGSIDGQATPLVQALRQLLSWRTGVVSFVVGSKLPPPPGAQPMAALLMQAMQAPAPPTPKSTRPTNHNASRESGRPPVPPSIPRPPPLPDLSPAAETSRALPPSSDPRALAPSSDPRALPPSSHPAPLPSFSRAAHVPRPSPPPSARSAPAPLAKAATTAESTMRSPSLAKGPRPPEATEPTPPAWHRVHPNRSARGMLTPPPMAPPRVQPK